MLVKSTLRFPYTVLVFSWLERYDTAYILQSMCVAIIFGFEYFMQCKGRTWGGIKRREAKCRLAAVRGKEASGMGVVIRLGMDGVYDAGVKNILLNQVPGKVAQLLQGGDECHGRAAIALRKRGTIFG